MSDPNLFHIKSQNGEPMQVGPGWNLRYELTPTAGYLSLDDGNGNEAFFPDESDADNKLLFPPFRAPMQDLLPVVRLIAAVLGLTYDYRGEKDSVFTYVFLGPPLLSW